MLRVFSLHPKTVDVDSLKQYLRIHEQYDIVWDPRNPDILFVSEWIYYSKEYFENFRILFDVAKIKVFLTYEAIAPDWNLFDYAVGFDNHLQNGDRFIRLMSPYDLYPKFVSSRKNNIDSIEKARLELDKKSKFCNFLYSNPNAHPMRDTLFYKISEYKKVDSLGRHLNNVEKEGTGFVGHSMECVPMKRPYKFSIASENANFSGYTSEKILTSLEAHTIPIYFGNPDIVEDINPKAFINASEFASLDELVDYVREVDTNDELWCEYIKAPWLTKEQECYHAHRTEEYLNRIGYLLTGTIYGKERIANGTAQDLYRKSFFDKYSNGSPKSIRQYIRHAFKKFKIIG